MSRKAKGINAERALLKQFWNAGWPCIRSAGSGSMQYPSPDLLVGNIAAGTALAIECKTTKNPAVYLKRKEIEELRYFAEQFGALALVAVYFDQWYFLTLDALAEHDASFSISQQQAKQKGMVFDELIGFLKERAHTSLRD